MMKLAWYWYVLIGIVSIAAIYGIYEFLNEKHIEKYGYPILDFEFLPMAIGSGSVIRIGCWWREYALHHAKNMLYPNLFLGFFIFGAIFLLLGYCMKYYQKKRHLGWLNILIGIISGVLIYYLFGVLIAISIFFKIGEIAIENDRYNVGRRPRHYDQYYRQ